jgi:alpha-mannosidase
VRKVARTTANMTNLLETEPEFIFAMSQAHQYAWIKEHRPEVYEKVVKAVSEGRFVPTGGMWTEADTNMPSSEAMARQFVHGKRFFLEEFGVENEEAWLPDTFGFAGGLPQIIKAAGSKWLLTQKISWSKTNTFPHHTFLWEGVDGTRIFTHFPPVDTYNCSMKGREIAHAARNFKEKGSAARSSLAPTGWGDGGGGTTREMIAKAARLRDLEGSAKVEWTRPADFFAKAEAEYQDPQVWVGELYLELHRATLTTQVGTKQGNRNSENLLREAEQWSATAAVRAGFDYPYAALDRIWKEVLTHQFHDILPGSSIAWVHRETEAAHAKAAEDLTAIIDEAQRTLAGDPASSHLVVFNAAPHARAGIPALAAAPTVPPSGASTVTPRPDGGFVLDNGLLRAEIDERGLLVSVFDYAADRETIAPDAPANLLQLHQDFPNQWDAWDVDKHYRNSFTNITTVDELTDSSSADGDGACVTVTRTFGASSVIQIDHPRGRRPPPRHPHPRGLARDREVPQARLPARRARRAVRGRDPVRPPVPGHAREHELGGGQVRGLQPQVPALRGARLGRRAGHRIDVRPRRDPRRARRGPGHDHHRPRLTAARPEVPGPAHRPGQPQLPPRPRPRRHDRRRRPRGLPQQPPERRVHGDAVVEPLVTVDNDAVVVSALKLADDGSGDVVVRCYEAHGGRASALVTPGFAFAGEVEICDLLERRTEAAQLENGAVRLRLRPFQLVTLRFKRA